MEERQRVKNVDYVGSKKVERAKIEEKLKELNTGIRLDTFIDPALIRKSRRHRARHDEGEGVPVGRGDARNHAGGRRAQAGEHRRSTCRKGRRSRFGRVDFVGNQAIGDGTLRTPDEGEQGALVPVVDHRARHLPGDQVRGRRRARDRVLPRSRLHPRAGRRAANHGARRILADKKTRWIELRDPGHRRATATASAVSTSPATRWSRSEALKPLFKLKNGDYYNQKEVRKGFQKAQEIYGAGGYMEFTGYPDYKFSDEPDPTEPADARGAGGRRGRAVEAPPTVDVTLQIQEGKQYFINRIIFTGNTTTRDNVIRREMRLYENGVFDTEALKYSIKRLNQLGYFKPLEGPGKDVNIDKTPTADEQGRRAG